LCGWKSSGRVEAIPSPRWEGFNAWKERTIDAEIERRRIRKIQRDNMRRAARGEPLINP
jgi:hypothetical protein